jgi:hypothetical protein
VAQASRPAVLPRSSSKLWLPQVVSGDQTGCILMWNAQNGQCEGGFSFSGGSGSKLTALAFDANQRRLLTASEAGAVPSVRVVVVGHAGVAVMVGWLQVFGVWWLEIWDGMLLVLDKLLQDCICPYSLLWGLQGFWVGAPGGLHAINVSVHY